MLVLLPAVPVVLRLRREPMVPSLAIGSVVAVLVAGVVIVTGRRANHTAGSRSVRSVLVSMLLPVALAAGPPAIVMFFGLAGWLIGEYLVVSSWRSPLERLFLSCGDIVVMRWIRAAALGPSTQRLGNAIAAAVTLRCLLAAVALIVLFGLARRQQTVSAAPGPSGPPRIGMHPPA